MSCRGIRGATTVKADESALILATNELLVEILRTNPGFLLEDIGSAFFTMTEDLVSVYPALAARKMGWEQVPMICAREIPVPGSLPFCIRVLIIWNTDRPQTAIKHVYLRDAVTLRPDIINSAIETGS
jgi:chorismate mutase